MIYEVRVYVTVRAESEIDADALVAGALENVTEHDGIESWWSATYPARCRSCSRRATEVNEAGDAVCSEHGEGSGS